MRTDGFSEYDVERWPGRVAACPGFISGAFFRFFRQMRYARRME